MTSGHRAKNGNVKWRRMSTAAGNLSRKTPGFKPQCTCRAPNYQKEGVPAAVRESLRLQGTMVNVRGGGIRVSPHFYNTEEELSEFFRQLDGVRRA